MHVLRSRERTVVTPVPAAGTAAVVEHRTGGLAEMDLDRLVGAVTERVEAGPGRPPAPPLPARPRTASRLA